MEKIETKVNGYPFIDFDSDHLVSKSKINYYYYFRDRVLLCNPGWSVMA